MEPFSLTAGALGITGFMISRFVEVRDAINGLQDAKKAIKEIPNALDDIQRSLESLNIKLPSNEALDAVRESLEKTGLVSTVEHCSETCGSFKEKLDKWTKYSRKDGKMNVWERFSVGLVNREKIKTFQLEVHHCQTRVQLALQSTQWLVQLRQYEASTTQHAESQTHLRALEDLVAQHISLCKTQQSETQACLESLLSQNPETSDLDPDNQEAAEKEILSRQKLIEEDFVSSGVIFSQVNSARKGEARLQSIGKIVASEQSDVFVGLPESVVKEMDQRLGDVMGSGGSRIMAGVYPPGVGVGDFFAARK